MIVTFWKSEASQFQCRDVISPLGAITIVDHVAAGKLPICTVILYKQYKVQKEVSDGSWYISISQLIYICRRVKSKGIFNEPVDIQDKKYEVQRR